MLKNWKKGQTIKLRTDAIEKYLYGQCCYFTSIVAPYQEQNVPNYTGAGRQHYKLMEKSEKEEDYSNCVSMVDYGSARFFYLI